MDRRDGGELKDMGDGGGWRKLGGEWREWKGDEDSWTPRFFDRPWTEGNHLHGRFSAFNLLPATLGCQGGHPWGKYTY